jgi:glycosyltransferase involved in cell wall biosynthesis
VKAGSGEASQARVLRLITRLNVGGPARQALLLTRELAATFPTLLAAGQVGPSEGELSDDAVAVVPVPLGRSINPRLDALAYRRVRALARTSGVALLHTHMAKAGSIGRAAVRSLPDRPRTVHTFHGHVLEGYFRPTVQRGFIEIERRLAKTTDRLIAVSPEIKSALLELGIGNESQYEVIPLGLDLDAFLEIDSPRGGLRQSLGLEASTPLVGIVGRLVPIKDVGMMIRAIERLPEAHLAVIGDGEERPALEAATRLAGLSDRVHFTGWWPDIPGAVSDLDVVALTSRNEGTPVALIEALAAGRPVVATDVGGVAHVVEHESTGLLAAAGDDEMVAAHIDRYLRSPQLRQATGEAGRASVGQRFGKDRLVADIAALYTELIG